MPPKTNLVLYPYFNLITLYQNRFRGKPALSEFDWPFTPNHKSSPPFATDVGSVLHPDTLQTSTCSWLDHTVSGFINLTWFVFTSPTSLDLSSQDQWTRWPIMQKVRGHLVPEATRLPLLVYLWFQVLFHSLFWVLFTFPLRYFVHYQSLKGILTWQAELPFSNRFNRCPLYLCQIVQVDAKTRRRGNTTRPWPQGPDTGLSPSLAVLSRTFLSFWLHLYVVSAFARHY